MAPNNNDIIVNSWVDLQDELFRNTWNSEIHRFRSPFVYRGLSDSRYRLLTSLIRLDGKFEQLEKHLLRSFRKYGEDLSTKCTSIWHLLTIAQHYGLPTRLMDWTYSPYIALHFATANHEKFGLDGVIWEVNFQKAHNQLPENLKRYLQAEGAQAFTVELLSALFREQAGDGCATEDTIFHDILRSLEEFDQHKKLGEFLLFFEPPSMDERIVNQYALFSVMPNSSRAIDDWLEKHPDLYRRIIIPADIKWEIRDKLDQCNITERVLFPGLDGLSKYLRRYYSPKQG